MKRPLFASSRDFVRDCCGVHAIYFDPLDPFDISTKIINWFDGGEFNEKNKHIEDAYSYAKSLPNGKSRAESYIEILNSVR